MAIVPLGCCNTPGETRPRGFERARAGNGMEGGDEESAEKQRKRRLRAGADVDGGILDIRDEEADA